MIGQFFKWIKLSFYRSFSIAKFRQLLWLTAFIISCYVIFFLVNQLLENKIKDPVHIIELMIDPGAVSSGSDNEGSSQQNRFFDFVIAIFGAIFFTGAFVSVISNMLEARVEAYKNGLVRYRFSNHILILGGDRMLSSIVKGLVANSLTAKKDIVVLSTQNIPDLHNRLRSELTLNELRHIILLFGNRNSEEELVRARLLYADRVYIIGESGEVEHDSLNISSYEHVKKLVSSRKEVLKCYVVINNLTSYHVFQYQKASPVLQTELTLIDIHESWAQQVLVNRKYSNLVYPAIDREGIGADSNKRVHFVVIGMNQMGLAMATTVAHIAHFPNFKTKHKKTKITFIAPEIEQEMNFFKGHYQSLFELSHSTYRTWNYNGNEREPIIQRPASEYGDFLDVEWEFVCGGIETEPIRNLLSQWCTHQDFSDDILTIAICGKNPIANLATALYLPNVIHRNKIPIFVYQPDYNEIAEQASRTSRYEHIYPFGMSHDCYDIYLSQRILHAKRINYIYSKSDHYVFMPEEAEINSLWHQLSFANQLSNIYAANFIYTKLRSMRVDHIDPFKLTEEQLDAYAEVEHNRWNIEKLLVGFSAMTIKERMTVSNEEATLLKKESFIHKDIAPYDCLDEHSKHYDKIITRFMTDVINSNDSKP